MGRLIPPVAKEKVVQWYPMAEGSGDVVGYGGGTRHGPTWIEDDKWMGGYALEGDGVDDYVETTNWGEFNSRTDEGWAICFTVEVHATGSHVHYFGARNESRDAEFSVRMRARTGDLPDLNVRISDGELFEVETEESFGVNNTVRFVVQVTGELMSNNVEIWKNGTKETLHVHSSGTSSVLSDVQFPYALFAQNNSGDIINQLDGAIDDFIVYGDSLTESEIQQDYLRQHWV